MTHLLLLSAAPEPIETLLKDRLPDLRWVSERSIEGVRQHLESGNHAPFLLLADQPDRITHEDCLPIILAQTAPRKIPVVVITSQASGISAALEMGAAAAWRYPYLPAEITGGVKHWQHFWRLSQDNLEFGQRLTDNERLVTIGRLTASIVHNISNPMQAMRGALTLALEDSHNPADVEEYVRLTQQELERVARMVNRMRQLYRPQTDQLDAVNLPAIVRDAFDLAREEAMRQKVKINDQLADTLPPVRAVSSQLHLALLSFVLNLTDFIGAAGGGDLWAQAEEGAGKITLNFVARAVFLPLTEGADPEDSDTLRRLAPMANVIHGIGGAVQFLPSAEQTTLRVELPRY
jgi:signal transduction histidine kinase